jgi:predicted dehydrogenase
MEGAEAMVDSRLSVAGGRCVSQQLRTGVVGAGVFGAFHAAKHAASPASQLTAVYDANPARASRVAADHGAATAPTFDALVSAVDAVVIASPAERHFEQARAAIEAGRHVYVEKPLALSVAEADALIALADAKGVILQVGHQERFVLAALGLPRDGATPQRLEFTRCGPPTGRGEDVSVVYDLMIHDLDLTRLFVPSAPIAIEACGTRDETVATIGFVGEATATLIASRRAGERRRRMIATYDDGVIDIDFVARKIVNTTAHAAPANVAESRAFLDPLGASVDAFLAAALHRTRSPIDGRAGRGAIDLAERIEAARALTNGAAAQVQKMIA